MSAAPAYTPEVLASLAHELEHAGELCDRLEMLVTQLVRASRGEPLQIALTEAQTLDVLTQHLAALALDGARRSALLLAQLAADAATPQHGGGRSHRTGPDREHACAA